MSEFQVVQGLTRSKQDTRPLNLTDTNEVITSQGLPPYTEAVRKGTSWATMSTSAVAGLVVRPSTTAAFEIFNGYAAGGKSLIIDRLFWFNLVSVTGVANAFLGWAQVTTVKAAPSDGSFVVRGSRGDAYGGPVIAAASTTVIASGWFPWAAGGLKSTTEASVTPAGGAVAEVNGRLIVPPQSSLCLHAVGPTTAATFTQGASWFEEVLTY